MANPKLTYKEEEAFSLNENIKRLFQVIYQEQNEEEKDEEEVPKIKVSNLISKVAFYYEKIRNAVDYKEESLLLKNAIARILRRQIIIEGAIAVQELKGRGIARHLLLELIRAGYLPNNKLPENKIDEIGAVIEKYIKLKKYSLADDNGLEYKEKNDFTKWIITLAAGDIEERLNKSKEEKIVISNLYGYLVNVINLPGSSIYQKDREIQIYASIHRLFLKYDKDLIAFVLFKYYNANWQEAGDEEILKIGKNIHSLKEAIDGQINHPLTKKLDKIVKRYSGYYTILVDVIKNNPVNIYQIARTNPESFLAEIKAVCAKRYKAARKKLKRAAFRSMLYIFITKSVFAVLLEVPASRWFGEEINPLALAVNVSLPAILLILAVFFTKIPGEANTKKIVEGINEIVFKENARQEPFILQEPAKRGPLLNAFFGLIYTITFFFSLCFVIWILDKIGFNWVSITIFLFFLAFASFFTIRIRKGVKELVVVEPKENAVGFLLDFFFVPIVMAGKWLSEKFSRINVFVFILDFIIEAPFKVFLEIIEEWAKYVKERKEEIT